MSAPALPPCRALGTTAFWLVGLVTLALLVFSAVSRTYPELPGELTLTLKFPVGNAGRIEPLISSGKYGDSDFIAIKYLGENSATLDYDYWGFGGPASERITFKPGAAHTLRIAMPAFTALRGSPPPQTAPLLLVFDGREILKKDVRFHQRGSDEIFFGTNPVGGTTGGGSFHGEILTAAGKPLRGPPAAFSSWSARLAMWITDKPGEAIGVAVISLALAWVAQGLLTWFIARRQAVEIPTEFAGNSRAPHLWFLGSVTLCALAFAYVTGGYGFHLVYPESFGNFYDYQAVSLLHGHLDVPEAALSAEAFVFSGKFYGYFGPTPALLRIPFVLFGVAFGQLSRCYLLGYFVASLAAVYAILIHASRSLSRRPTWPARTDVVLLIVGSGLGSSLFFLSSRAYIYHEAIACGTAFALWSGWCTLRWIAEPGRRWWLGALVGGALSVHARPPVGLFALTLLGCAAAAEIWRLRAAGLQTWVRPTAIGALSVMGVLSFNGLSYIKFKSFDGAPLKYHVQYNPERLAAIDGKNFHVSNFRYNFDGYVWRPNFLFRGNFPYFYIVGRNPNEYPGSKIDLAEPALALPYTAPAVVFLAVAGGILAFARWPESRTPLAILGFAVIPMAAALFMAIAISHRYTADFCPALVIGAAFGLVAGELLPQRLHLIFRIVTTGLVICAIFVTVTTTLHYQGEGVWGVPDATQAHYSSLRKTFDGVFRTTSHDR